jgi:lysophospholipase L1-like esterase
MKRIVPLLLIACLAAAPATSPPPSTRNGPQRADVAAPKISATTQHVERFHQMHEQFVQKANEGNIDLLFLGDSITEGWRLKGATIWDDFYKKRNPANFGISGDKTQHVLWRIENGELDNIKPKVVVLMIGTNNIPMSNVGGDRPAEIAKGIEKIVTHVRRETRAKVLLLGIFPRGTNEEKDAPARAAVAEVNATISKLDDGVNVRYLDISDKFLQPDKSLSKDLQPDFLHLSNKGYKVWADAMEPLLAEMLKSPEFGTPTTQRATDPTPKFDVKTGQIERSFLAKHEKFLEQANSAGIDLLFIGDSITQGWSNNEVWQKSYGPRNAANFGIGGDRTQHVLWRINNGELDGIKPKVVVLLMGTNNVKWNQPTEIAAAIKQTVITIRHKTKAKVLLLGVFPRGWDDRNPRRPPIKQINQIIASLDDGQNVRFLDFGHKFLEADGVSISKEIMPDALHLSVKGYQIWADAMEPLLAEMMK